jgi:hypothetical protein
VLLTGPFGGFTDDVREFLRCLDGDDPDGLAWPGAANQPRASAARGVAPLAGWAVVVGGW